MNYQGQKVSIEHPASIMFRPRTFVHALVCAALCSMALARVNDNGNDNDYDTPLTLNGDTPWVVPPELSRPSEVQHVPRTSFAGHGC